MTRSNRGQPSAPLLRGLCGIAALFWVQSASAQTAVTEATASASTTPGSTAQLCDDRAEEGSETAEQQAFCRHRRKGLALYDAQQFADAIVELMLAYRIYPAPRILYKIGHAHRKLGQLREARQFLSMFLSVDPTIPLEQRSRIVATLHELEEAIVRLERNASPVRPRWRLGLGAGLNGAGAVLLGFGIPALAVDGACVHSPALPGSQCPTLFQTSSVGSWLVVPGTLLLVAGTLTAAWPAPKKSDRNRPDQQALARKE